MTDKRHIFSVENANHASPLDYGRATGTQNTGWTVGELTQSSGQSGALSENAGAVKGESDELPGAEIITPPRGNLEG